MAHLGQVTAEPPRETEGGFLALMRHRNYALLWMGQLVSNVGDRLQWVVISLWVYAQTGSALSVSYAIMALMVGPAIVGVFAGPLVDRLDRRKILIYGDLLRAVLVFAIPDLMVRSLVWVYVDLFLISSVSAFFRPAMYAIIPQSVPKARLLQANAFFASMDMSTEIFGPFLAGLVGVWRGYEAGVYINAFSYLVSAVFSSALRLSRSEYSEGGRVPTRPDGIVQSVREGLLYIRSDRVQVALLAILLAGGWLAGLSSLQTPLAKGVLTVSDQEFAWFQSIWGIGFVSASLLLGWYGVGIPRGQTIVFGYLFWALATGAMGLSPNYASLVVSGFWVGFANMLMFVSTATVLMEHTQLDKIGRTLATRQIVLAIIRVTALLGFGWLADLTSVRFAILTMATISFSASLGAAVLFPALWRYRVEAAQDQTHVAVPSFFSALKSSSAVWRYFAARTEPEFITSEQRWLNVAVLLIVVSGWLALLVILPIQAFGILVTIGVTFLVANLARSLARRLRASHPGQERFGGGSTP